MSSLWHIGNYLLIYKIMMNTFSEVEEVLEHFNFIDDDLLMTCSEKSEI